MEAYDIDNHLYDDNVPLNDFFNNCPEHLWFYGGIMELAFAPKNECNIEKDSLLKKHKLWREKYLDKMMELDEKWMNYITKI